MCFYVLCLIHRVFFSEIAYIYIDSSYVGECTELDDDCSYDLVECGDFSCRDISSYINETASYQQLNIGIDVSAFVNICPYLGGYLYAYVTVSCGNCAGDPNSTDIGIISSSSTTTPPFIISTTNDEGIRYDSVEFYVDDDGSDEKTSIYACNVASCGVSKQWNIIGTCQNPTLSISVLETDYASTSFSFL